jgi:iron(III) transport system substrate-binding protein
MKAIRSFSLLAVLLFQTPGNAWSQIVIDSALAKINSLPAKERHDALIAGARKEGAVEWYGSLLINEVTEISAAFKKRYPFLEIKYTRGGGTSLIGRLLTEQKTGSSKVDIFSGRGNLHVTLMKAGFPAKNLAPFRQELREGFMDKDGFFAGQYAYSLVIAYNTRNIASNRAPTAYQDLLNPEWKGQMALDIESYDWLAGMMDTLGEEAGIAFARKLALQNIRLQRGHSLLTQLIAAGELKVMVDGYHYQILTLRQKGAPLDFTVPDPMIIKEPSGVWISRRAPHPHGAALLVDFLFSPEGQQFHARQFFLAARKDINCDFGGKTIRGIRFLSAEKWGERYSELIKQFDEIFRKKAD